MKLIGLAGPLRVGKDTVADYLVAQHNFIRFSFSDALYTEVRQSYGRGEDDLLVHPKSPFKETPHSDLALANCASEEFRNACANEHFHTPEFIHQGSYHTWLHAPRSPRWVLQMWGTEYRRKADPDYWVKRAKDFSDAFLDRARNGEPVGASGLVNTSVRFENERAWIKSEGGEIWHIHRRDVALDRSHEAEKGLDVQPGDREIFNNSTIERLNTATSLMLHTRVESIALEG